MSTSDGNSTTRPLRRRKSKRFDRSGGSPVATASTVLDDGDVDVDLPDDGPQVSREEAVTALVPATEISPPQPAESAGGDDHADAEAEPAPVTPSETEPVDAEPDTTQGRPDVAARHRTLDQLTLCGRCGHEVSTVHIEVDDNVLMMESCDNCDTRRWQLAGEPIELKDALDTVGEHTGRRR